MIHARSWIQTVAPAFMVLFIAFGCSSGPPAPNNSFPQSDLDQAMDDALDQLETDGKITADEKARIKDNVKVGQGKMKPRPGDTGPGEPLAWSDGTDIWINSDAVGQYAEPGDPWFGFVLKILLMHEIFHLKTHTTTCTSCSGPAEGSSVVDEGSVWAGGINPTCDHVGL